MIRLSRALERTKSSRGRLDKERALADAFALIGRDSLDEDSAGSLRVAVRLATGAVTASAPIGVGFSLMQEVIIAETGWDSEVVRACSRTCGDMAEAFGLLMQRVRGADRRSGVSLSDVARTFELLAQASSRAHKRRHLDELFHRATPLEAKYLAKVILGSLRTGALEGVVENAIARAFAQPLEEVRRAATLVTDPGELAVLARDGRLAEASMSIGAPVAFMLATPIETVATTLSPAQWTVEDKYDGVRAQLHLHDGEAIVFARGLERVTETFPEVARAAAERGRGRTFAIDGELLAVGEGDKPRPFMALQQRLGRKAPTAATLAATPVAFIAYDLLAIDGKILLEFPLADRRALLAELTDALDCPEIRLSPSTPLLDALDPLDPLETDALSEPTPELDVAEVARRLDGAFAAARGRGHEGLVLKRNDAPYEAGRRGQSWLKVKRAFATLDVVITAAEEGHGRRAGVLSDYTFAVWRDEGDARALVNVGKAYSGLTDVEIDDMTRRLTALTLGRYGGARLVRPEIVLEVAFDGLQRSKRHKSGFALRFPRIVRIRTDKTAEQADDVATVEKLFASQVGAGHREEGEAKTRGRGRRGMTEKGETTRQLGLFGEEK